MSFQKELLKEINEVRTNPKKYAKKVEKYISYFKGKTLMIPGKNAGMKTEEGAEAYKEAVDYLSKVDPVKPLEPSIGLSRISKDFLEEVQKVDPSELNNINIDEITKKYGSFEGVMNREIDMGNETPEEIVMSIVTSDGDATRGHRDSLLSTDLKKFGAANGKHDIYRFCTIIIFCTKFNNNFDDDDNGFFDGDNSHVVEKEDKKEEKIEGQTLKPKKVVLRQAPKEIEKPKKEQYEVIDNEEEEREDVVSEKRNEKIVIEKGKKKKIITITRTLVDGSKEVETIKKIIKEGEE